MENSRLLRILTARYLFPVFLAFGFLYMFFVIDVNWQIFNEYINHRLFDTPTPQIIWAEIFIIIPVAFTGAYIVKLAIREWKFAHFARTAFIDEQYKASFTPTEASILFGGRNDSDQAAALLAEMVALGIITTDDYFEFNLSKLSEHYKKTGLRPEYKQVISEVFAKNPKVSIRGWNDKLQVALRSGVSIVRENLKKKSALGISDIELFFYKFFSVTFWLSIPICLGYFYGYFSNPDFLINVTDRRYEIEPFVIKVSLTIVLLMILVPLFELVRPDYTPKGQQLRKEALGLRLFIKQVYRGKLSIKQGTTFVSKEEFDQYLPYAVGFGLDRTLQKRL